MKTNGNKERSRDGAKNEQCTGWVFESESKHKCKRSGDGRSKKQDAPKPRAGAIRQPGNIRSLREMVHCIDRVPVHQVFTRMLRGCSFWSQRLTAEGEECCESRSTKPGEKPRITLRRGRRQMKNACEQYLID